MRVTEPILTAIAGMYMFCTMPVSKSTAWKPLVEAYTTLLLPPDICTISTSIGLFGKSGKDYTQKN